MIYDALGVQNQTTVEISGGHLEYISGKDDQLSWMTQWKTDILAKSPSANSADLDDTYQTTMDVKLKQNSQKNCWLYPPQSQLFLNGRSFTICPGVMLKPPRPMTSMEPWKVKEWSDFCFSKGQGVGCL